jgi:4-amino-4-deoxy-L-arabinose transferase-like glycosyltransferase
MRNRLLPLAAAAIVLVAIAADVVFALDRSETVIALSVVSTVIIAASVFLMFGGGEDDETSPSHGHAEP